MPARRLPTCPVCGTPRARELVYGLVIGEALDDPDVVLAGCLVPQPTPRYECRASPCGAQFGRYR